MKLMYTLIALAVVGGLFLLLATQNAETPADTNTENTVPMEQPTSEDTESAAIEQMSDTEMTAPAETEDTSAQGETTAHTFSISGTNYAFDLTEITVNEGDTVTINFESAEGFHDWVVDEFDAATEKVRPGTPTSVTFVADKAGTYEYYCSIGSHRANGMIGTLTVQ